MTDQEAVAKLNALTGDNPEGKHSAADSILIEVLREHGHNDVADAWEAARARVPFWYS